MANRDFPFCAVLTGDLIASRTSGTVDSAMQALSRSATEIASDGPVTLFDRHRGDGWQVFLSEGAYALRAALRLVAALKAAGVGLETRIGIGIGAATLPDSQDLGAASGEAFTLAGDVLEGLGRAGRIGMPPLPGPCDAAYQAMVALLDRQSRSWKPAQARALFAALERSGPTQEDIAERLGVTRQAVQVSLSSVGLPALDAALHAFESQIAAIWSQRTSPA